jgi:thiol-disulfide isomerase/thioredoxin
MRTLFAAVALSLVACGGGPAPAASPSGGGAKVGFSLPSDQGALVTVPLPGARATVLDFFSPTCEPCKKKVPELLGKRDVLAAKGAKIVLVAVLADSESTQDARRALASWGAEAPFLVDRGDTSKVEAGVTTLPSTLVLDASGQVKFRSTANSSVDDIVAAAQ